LGDHRRQRPARLGGVPADSRDERHRQLDGEHRSRVRHRDMPGTSCPLHVPVCLPRRATEPLGQLRCGIGGRDAVIQQISGSIDPLRELVGASATTASRSTLSHVTNVLLEMSHLPGDTPRTLQPAVVQRHLEAEVAHCVGGVISPLLSNIYLHAFDRAWTQHGTGELVRYADDFVVLCSSAEQAEQAQQRARALLGNLGLALHPDKTRVVDLREGNEGFDFLGCHLRARMSGRLWEQKRIVRYYLHRWPSMRSMKRARARIRDLTDRRRVGMQLEDVIGDLNLFLRGWGNYFRTGNAADKFIDLDRHVAWRLKRLLIKKRGRNLRAGQASKWTRTWFHDQGLHQLMGTIRYPKTA
jgi:hypothetical protein